MAWSHLDITKPHLVYIILGGFTSLFMLCSSFIKERMYIGEATVATLCGIIFGPHAANLINPASWGSVDIITIEFSRIVLVVQCFAVGVELPKFYMEKHWKSVVYLLVPVMTFGWLIVSLFVWWMIPPLDWLDSLVIAACITATDPVLASSVVGRGKFAKRVPKHLRDLLSAESGCNDGMAFPFIYLSLYLIQYHRSAEEVSFHFVVYVILYECVFGAVYGFVIGYIARHGIKIAERHDLIDRESFLVFYFVVALFCAGSGSILGVDDLLVGFAAGVGFSNDGWFGEKTEESHVSNVIDLLINLAYFVYFGTIIPWEQYNNNIEGLQAWRLVVIAILVIFFRRIPAMLALKPLIPDIKTWREALFAGHFGPIGVGAIFVAILARAELEHDEPVPLSELPPEGSEYYSLIYLVWPIVTFIVITSILVHGSSIAVFTLGKRINTLTLTMSYTAAPEDGPTWMNRLPRISSQSRSQAKAMSETSMDDKEPEFPPGTLAPPGFLRRQKEDDDHSRSGSRAGSRASSLVSRRRKHKRWDDGIGPGGPVSQSAIFPNRSSTSAPMSPTSPTEQTEKFPAAPENTDSTLTDETRHDSVDLEKAVAREEAREEAGDEPRGRRQGSTSPHRVEIYEEGDQMVFENEDGEVLDVQPSPNASRAEIPRPNEAPAPLQRSRSKSEGFAWTMDGFRKKMSDMYSSEVDKRKGKEVSTRRHEPARAFQFGNTIIVEDEDGEVVKTYELPSQKGEGQEGQNAFVGTSLKYMGLGGIAKPRDKNRESVAEQGGATGEAPAKGQKNVWTAGLGRLGGSSSAQRAAQAKLAEQAEADDKKVRFTIGGVDQRMTKEDFLMEVQKLNAGARKEVVDRSTASPAVKRLAKQDDGALRRPSQPAVPQIVAQSPSPSRERPARQRSSASPAQRVAATAGESSSSSRSPTARDHPSEELGETAVERKRRLAVLATQADDDAGETPAERRRREAALGMGYDATAEESDSEDEGSERVPPARRGIRFAEPTRKK